MQALEPDLYAALGDEVLPGAVPKRIRLSVDRTLRWLDSSLRDHTKRRLSCPLPMAAIQGGDSIEQRTRSAQESAKRDTSGKTAWCQLPVQLYLAVVHAVCAACTV